VLSNISIRGADPRASSLAALTLRLRRSPPKPDFLERRHWKVSDRQLRQRRVQRCILLPKVVARCSGKHGKKQGIYRAALPLLFPPQLLAGQIDLCDLLKSLSTEKHPLANH